MDFAERLKEANVLITRARDDAEQSHWAAAYASYSKAASSAGPFPGLVRLGSLYVRLGLWQNAADDYAKA